MVDWSKPVKSSSVQLLDDFYLFNTAFVVCTQAGTDTDLNAPLAKGINFVSNIKPQGVLGILESTFNQVQSLLLHGQILLPRIGQNVPPREPFKFPWEDRENVPGLHLAVELTSVELGENTFDSFKLRTYSPIAKDWLEENSTQQPLTCFTGGLAISSAKDISIELVAEYQPGSNDLYLAGIGQGLSIANLADMLHISGSSDSESVLPSDLQKLVSGLSKIELQSLGLGLSLGTFPPQINYSMFTIGLSEIDWEIWKGHFALTGLGCRFEVFNPFDSITRSLDATLMAKTEIEGQELDIYASSRDQFTFYANLQNATISLSSMLKSYDLPVDPPSDLVIDSLRVGIAPMKSYSFALFMASQPNSWTIDLGPKTLSISDVTTSLAYPSGGPVAGSFGGTLAIDGIGSLSCHYSLSGELMAYTYIPKISFDDLLKSLTLDLPIIPSGFHLEFDNSYAMVQHSQASNMFLMSTEVDGFGTVSFQALKSSVTGGSWGFAFGMNLGEGSLSAINGLSLLSPFESLFQLQELVLVVASFEATGFAFPGMEQFNQPAIASKNVALPSQSNGVVAGLNLYGQWQIDTEDKKQKLLKDILGLNPTLGITLQVGINPTKDASLYVSYSGHLLNMPLSCRFGARMRDAVPELFLSGTMQAEIQGSQQTFTITMDFTPNGAFASGTMQGSKPIDFEVFKLGDLALELGASYEGIPSLGLAGTILVDNFMSSIAVFFDSAVPSQSMVAGAVSDLHLGDVLDTLTGDILPSDIDSVLNQVGIVGTKTFSIAGTVMDDLKQRNLGGVSEAFAAAGVVIPATSQQLLVGEGKNENTWFVTDMANEMRHYQLSKSGDQFTVEVNPQFYCAPQATSIGELRFSAGFFISGRVNFFGLYAEATIDISPNKGIAVDAQMSKIVLGNENLFCIKAAEGSGGPQISIATFSQPEQKVPEFRKPHFYINGMVELLGMSRSVFINISTSGAQFDLKGDLLPGGIVQGELEGTFDSPTNASVEGDVKVGIGDVDLGPLGTFKIETGATGALDIFIKGADLGAAITAGFELAGNTFNLPKLKIDVDTGDLAKLPKMLFDAIFDFLKELFTDPKEWAKVAKKALDWTEDKISGVLSDTFGLDKEQIKQVLDVIANLCPVTAALNAF